MILELNVRAKAHFEENEKRKRRNQMRQWRKQETLMFNNKADFDKWLDYTKWHKRPVKVSANDWSYFVTFLDYKGKKNAA
jgi:hypothetical protein